MDKQLFERLYESMTQMNEITLRCIKATLFRFVLGRIGGLLLWCAWGFLA